MDITALENCFTLTEFYTDKETTSSLYLYCSEGLTQECLHKIIENYADMTGETSPTLFVGEGNIIKIDEEHKAMLENKNISYQ